MASLNEQTFESFIVLFFGLTFYHTNFKAQQISFLMTKNTAKVGLELFPYFVSAYAIGKMLRYIVNLKY